ncbi:MAG: AarF/ABC1/UbiB kinase family protein [Candidatus Delongbacteria bacterium]|nr:AarF/ABC1/UbiB kinase family protein [Candidatus Delongbacteria bacterium]
MLHLNRYRRIINILVKNGFSELVHRIHLLNYQTFGSRIFTAPKRGIEALSFSQRFCIVLEELGPAFIKLGQLLSLRSFLLPQNLIDDLARLHDQVTPLPFKDIRAVLVDQWGAGRLEEFQSIDEIPIGTASLGQVHRAQLINGDQVIIKVLRPGVAHIMKMDLDILGDLAGLLERYLPELKRLQPSQIIQELKETVHRELNLNHESQHLAIFSKNFQSMPQIHIPRIYPEFSTEQVLVMEFIQGIKITDRESLKSAGISIDTVIHHLMPFVFKQIIEDGYFHADPHPGNLLVDYTGRIVPLDYGQVGRLSRENLNHLSSLMMAFWRQDVDHIARHLVEMEIVSDQSDLGTLKTDIDHLIYRYYGLPLNQIQVKLVIQDVYQLFNRHELNIPRDWVLLGKTLGTYEDIIHHLNPEFNFIESGRPYIRQCIKQKWQWSDLTHDGLLFLEEFRGMVAGLPREIRSLFKNIRENQIRIKLDIQSLKDLINELDRVSNRLSLSLIISALIIASSLILRSNLAPVYQGYSVVGIIGYLFAAVLGVILIISILKSGRW